jgi:calcium binding protein 39
MLRLVSVECTYIIYSMLRECVRHEHLAKILLHSDHLYDFFNYVEVSTFDIASDAFATFKVRDRYIIYDNIPYQDLITKHKGLCAEFLDVNYDKFFDSYQRLLASDNYVTRRQ